VVSEVHDDGVVLVEVQSGQSHSWRQLSTMRRSAASFQRGTTVVGADTRPIGPLRGPASCAGLEWSSRSWRLGRRIVRGGWHRQASSRWRNKTWHDA
jgi:hypothetical protein